MVIQRSWRANESGANILQSSGSTISDESNEPHTSNNIISSLITSCSSSKMDTIKYVTTPQMAESILSRLKQRFGSNVGGRKVSSDAAMRSLELLRITIQMAFDKEIDQIVKKYVELYFKPAVKNIKENLGDHVVTEDMLHKMMCALLENSKTQYHLHRNKSLAPQAVPSSSMAAGSQPDLISVKPESATQTNLTMKRSASKCSITDSTAVVTKRPALVTSQQSAQLNTSPQSLQQEGGPAITMPPRRQIFWNTAVISTETDFVLDVQANQAFGFGTDGKERLASKHPELIRYLPDGQDRDWLVEQKIIPAQNRNSRFLFLIHNELIKLAQLDLYKNRENLNLSILHVFKIPNFIINKMKLFFVDLNIKSKGLITNSYAVTANSSHLRNALLQGSQVTTFVGTATTGTTGGNTTNASTNSVSTSTDTGTSPLKAKSSLSSSHATLTALLTNNSTPSGTTKSLGVSDKRLADSSQSGITSSDGSVPKSEGVKEI